MRLPRRGSFLRNVFTLMAGTTVAQIIPIAASPILTRLYQPQEFGALALFTAIAAMVGIIATGRYELAIMLPQDEAEAVNLAAVSLTITLGLSAVSLLVVAGLHRQIANLLHNPDFAVWLFAIPVSVFLTGLQNTFNCWFNRQKRYPALSVSKITQSSVNVGATIGMGAAAWQKAGLITGMLLGQGVSTAYLGWRAWREDRGQSRLVSKTMMVRTARMYKDFPRINSLHAFFDMLQNSSVIFLLSSFFGPAVLGFYFLAVRILKTPLMFIGSSVSQVFYQKATETFHQEGDLQALVRKTILSLTAISLPIFLLILIFAPSMFALIFGETWRETGIYAQLLSPWLFLNFIVSPINQVAVVVGRLKKLFLFSIVGNSLILGALLIGSLVFSSIIKALVLLSLFMIIYYIIVILWIYSISKGHP